MNESFKNKLLAKHQECEICPDNDEIVDFFRLVVSFLYPHFAKTDIRNIEDIDFYIEKIRSETNRLFSKYPTLCPFQTEDITDQFVDFLPELYESLNKDVATIYEEDPAAKSHDEVIRCYPGFYAISAYRIAHKLLELGIKVIPRIITEHAHSHTGIDIHPGAQIGEYFCIDHGTGVVIGETTIIGNHVKLYQGVTLGALSVDKSKANVKRHPTIQDNVVIYSNATILGGKTIIGENSVIGGNVWITFRIPANSKVYYESGKTQIRTEKQII